jgi:plastocyanin
VTIRPGTQVTWTNHDDIPHNIVSSDQKFRSKALDTNDQFSFTFTEPGTYEYFCGLHPRMTGKIIVQQ